ncbi:uncharacterized protein TrAtP1_006807 [Trichoderma atroviride]|uniref:uncharacterized protein n=1 Tax=Hypocrea atroviridis TaxID=63577 RepID=UPI003317330D|nr:hypothetical protein TrAtP1_006807 [Trichoderma atroviride]
MLQIQITHRRHTLVGLCCSAPKGSRQVLTPNSELHINGSIAARPSSRCLALSLADCLGLPWRMTADWVVDTTPPDVTNSSTAATVDVTGWRVDWELRA